MDHIVGHIARRGFHAVQEIGVPTTPDATESHVYTIPGWGLAVIGATIMLYAFLVTMVSPAHETA